MTAETIVLIGLGCSASGALIGVLGYRRSVNKQNIDAGKGQGVLLTEIGYIKCGIDRIEKKQDSFETKHNSLTERVARVEESTKSAHHRIDRIEKKDGE